MNALKPTELPIFLDETGTPRANTRDMAAKLGWKHYNVLQKIDNLARDLHPLKLNDVGIQRLNTPHPTVPGRVDRSYNMDSNGFALLAMSFEGPELLPFKLAWLRRFREMEAELQALRANPSPGSRDDALIAALTAQTQMATSLMQVMQA